MSCPSAKVSHEHGSYLHEVWAWFALGSFVIFLRIVVRLRTVGWRGLQGDDVIALLVWLCFACDSITVTLVNQLGSNIDYTEEQLQTLRPCQLKQIEDGSRMQLLAWFTYTLLLWALKAMILFFLNRLTFGLFQQRLVKIFAVFVAITYLAVFLTLMLGCHPVERNWQVLPLPPLRTCIVRAQNFYVVTSLNVSTDLMIMSIPIPLLWGLRVPVGRKIGLTLLLCSGIFMVTAAVLRFAFSITSPSAENINRWGTRETIAGIVAVNAPIIKPLFSRRLWARDFISSSSPDLSAKLRQQRRRRDGAGGDFGNNNNNVNVLGTIGSSSRYKKKRLYNRDALYDTSISGGTKSKITATTLAEGDHCGNNTDAGAPMIEDMILEYEPKSSALGDAAAAERDLEAGNKADISFECDYSSDTSTPSHVLPSPLPPAVLLPWARTQTSRHGNGTDTKGENTTSIGKRVSGWDGI